MSDRGKDADSAPIVGIAHTLIDQAIETGAGAKVLFRISG